MARFAPPIPAAEAQRQRAQRRRRKRLVLGLAFGLPLFFLACALYLAFGPKPPPPPVVPRYTPLQAADAQRRFDAIRDQLLHPPPSPAAESPAPRSGPQEHARTVGTAPRRPPASSSVQHHTGPRGEDLVTLQISEPDLNAYLATNPKVTAALARSGVHAVQIILRRPADVLVRAAVTYRGRNANVQIGGTLAPDARTGLRFTATSAQVGILPMPARALTAQADRLAARFAGQAQGRLPLTVQKVAVVGDRLVLTGIANRPAPSASSAASPSPAPPPS